MFQLGSEELRDLGAKHAAKLSELLCDDPYVVLPRGRQPAHSALSFTEANSHAHELADALVELDVARHSGDEEVSAPLQDPTNDRVSEVIDMVEVAKDRALRHVGPIDDVRYRWIERALVDE